MSEQYDELKSNILDKYPAEAKAEPAGNSLLKLLGKKKEIGYFKGTRNPSTLMPKVVINSDASINLIENLGDVEKNPNLAKF